jgi:8-oxo-dGTP pyrophosphatase MutT (NUDIX family)
MGAIRISGGNSNIGFHVRSITVSEKPTQATLRNELATAFRKNYTMKKLLFSIASRTVLQPWFRLSRGLTLGVRICVLDGEQVLLVRHSYGPGWLFPGGGVHRGETIFDAAVRELKEESGVVADGPLRLHGFFSNHEHFRGDHIACFVVRSFSRTPWRPTLEIAEARFFPRDDLPPGTTGGTRRRIAEICDGTPPPPVW